MNKKLFLLKLTIIILIYLVIDSLLMYYYFIGDIGCGLRINFFIPIHIISPIAITVAYLLSNKNNKEDKFKKTLVLFIVLLLCFYVLLKLNNFIKDKIVVSHHWYSGCWTADDVNTSFDG